MTVGKLKSCTLRENSMPLSFGLIKKFLYFNFQFRVGLSRIPELLHSEAIIRNSTYGTFQRIIVLTIKV